MAFDDGNEAKNRNCPWCGWDQFTDPASKFPNILCENPACGQESSYGAWCNPSSNPHYMAISEGISDGVTIDLYKYSTAYTFKTDEGDRLASGTVVGIGNRILIATVRHSIPHDISDIGLVGKNISTLGDRSRWVLGSIKHDDLDIAAIEISQSALTDLNLTALPLNRIINIGTGEPAFKSRVFGFPWDFRAEHFPQKGILGFKALTYGCEVRHVSCWDKLRLPDLDPYSSIVAHYERQDNIDWSDPALSYASPHPGGMSGGGFWQREAPLFDNELWRPDAYFLFGIQSSWAPNIAHLRAVQIIHWLKLVADTYPDITADIKIRFPEVDAV